jgi:flagellar biosynthetic protein FliQ
MNEAIVLELARRALVVSLELALPILIISLVIGVAVGLFQAVTQVQEMTLTFVPKIFGVIIAILVLGPWMLSQLVGFASSMFSGAPGLIH